MHSADTTKKGKENVCVRFLRPTYKRYKKAMEVHATNYENETILRLGRGNIELSFADNRLSLRRTNRQTGRSTS